MGKYPQTDGMKKFKIKSSLLVGVATLLFSFPTAGKSDLTDIAKPYLGVYDCTQAQLNNEDLLASFDDLKLELKGKGEYVLYVKERGNKMKTVKGKYRYDAQSETITLQVADSRIFQRCFPLKKGVLVISVPYGDKTLRLQFTQK